MKIVMVSGGFDPLHIGHLAFFKEAKKFGEQLLVVVDCDEFVAKKHPVLMPQNQRIEIVSQLRMVDTVLGGLSSDNGVLPCLAIVRPVVYALGGDHLLELPEPPELDYCRKNGIRFEFISVTKRSSSWILEEYVRKV